MIRLELEPITALPVITLRPVLSKAAREALPVMRTVRVVIAVTSTAMVMTIAAP
jgi:hypothetical protein